MAKTANDLKIDVKKVFRHKLCTFDLVASFIFNDLESCSQSFLSKLPQIKAFNLTKEKKTVCKVEQILKMTYYFHSKWS